MGLFSTILDKIGIGSTKAAEVIKATVPADSPEPSTPPAVPATQDEVATAGTPAEPIAVVDVVARLEELAAANPQKLNWKTSIVDLLKLLGIDSSLEARRELARELDAPADKFSDSAALNIWLHKTVLQKLADNGGKVPEELLD